MKKLILIYIFAALLLPSVSFATIPKLTGPFLSCTGIPGGTTLSDGTTLPQCKDVCDILSTGKNILDFAVSALLFIIAPLIFIYGGVLLMVSGGNPGLHSKGVNALKTAVISILMVLAAYIIVNTFVTAAGIGASSNKTQNFIGVFTGTIQCSVPAYNPPGGNSASPGTTNNPNNPGGGICDNNHPNGTCPAAGQTCQSDGEGGYFCN